MNTKRKEYSNSYKSYVLLILTGVYTFNFIDRQILVILQESIKADLGLSDTQLGLLSGFTFAIFYVTLGIPVARLADRGNRRNIVAISLGVWSLMTAITGLAANYWQLLLARIGVGVGEAGGSPPAHSMISDYFPPERRATALSIYSIGIYIGILIGFVAGGWLDQHYGWRIALMVMGVPGIIYALILYFTVDEPQKGRYDDADLDTSQASTGEVVRLLFSKRTFVFVALGCGIHAFGSYGISGFYPSYLARVHEMGIGEIGKWLGLATGLGGALGTFAGGYLCDRYGRRDLRYYLWLPAFMEIIAVFFLYGAISSDDPYLSLRYYFLLTFCSSFYLGPMIAVTHTLVAARYRALSSAILFFILNLIGLGLGPMVVGMISDYLAPTYGVLSLRYAFYILYITAAVALLSFYMASRFYKEERYASLSAD